MRSAAHPRCRDDDARQTNIVAVLLALFLPLSGTAQAMSTPRFETYPAPLIKTVRHASPILTDPEARVFKTRLRRAAMEPVNFAGHFHFAVWGCGTSCETSGVVDEVTGRVTMMPFTICCADDYLTERDLDRIDVRSNSRLVLFKGKRNERGIEGRHYYLFDGSRFSLLRTVPFTTKDRAFPPD